MISKNRVKTTYKNFFLLTINFSIQGTTPRNYSTQGTTQPKELFNQRNYSFQGTTHSKELLNPRNSSIQFQKIETIERVFDHDEKGFTFFSPITAIENKKD